MDQTLPSTEAALHEELERLRGVVSSLQEELEHHKQDNPESSYARQLYKTLTDESSEMIFIVDDEGVVKYINAAAIALSGKDGAVVQGKLVGQVFAGKVYAMFSKGINNALRSERQQSLEECIMVDSNEMWVNSLFMPIIIPTSPTVQVLVIARDVTGKRSDEVRLHQSCSNMQKLFDEKVLELHSTTNSLQNAVADRLRMEDDLYKAKEGYKALVSNMPGAVYRCANDVHWTMEFLSEQVEELTGYPVDEILDNTVRSFASLILPEDAIGVSEAVEAGVNAKEPYEIHYRIKHKDGSIHRVYEKGRGVFDKDGELLWLEGVIFDVSHWGNGVPVL